MGVGLEGEVVEEGEKGVGGIEKGGGGVSGNKEELGGLENEMDCINPSPLCGVGHIGETPKKQ